MDAQELRNLQEAYLGVYELDEAEGSYGQTPKADAAYTALATAKGKSSKTKSRALKHAIRSAADRYNSDKPYSHRSKMTQSDRDYHRGQSENSGGDREGIDFDEFDTGASGPGGKPKGKKLERQIKRGVSAESFELYDVILSHLLDEGYADTQEAAEAIMVNMSEDWRESIVEDAGIVSGLVGLALGAKGALHAAKKTKRLRDYPKNFVKGIVDPRTYIPNKKKDKGDEN